ncbi:arachidonate 12-lipoxygenase, 12R-type-like [Poecilia formosa]|uniref:arachidonate 12-lipoxygenase, 12R-type-like n=1 Tax=Poecilia formosa TaxID=48698 RepID=UPI0007BA6AA8|nr:PREDICTED: arachidonate 12-lipoxygenase, 12R-type-like [Poecilia formosa]
MVDYEVTVYTANRTAATTFNNVFIKLVGTSGESERKWLFNLKGASAFVRGAVASFTVSSPTSLGKLVLVELDKQPLLLFPEDSWFPAKVEVKSPDGDIYNFPVYRWISDSKVHRFREGTALKGFEDSHHLGRYSREQELKQRQKDYCRAKMVDYEVTVYTANRTAATTFNNVFLKLVGTNGESERKRLLSLRGPSAFVRGAVASFTVSSPTFLGKLVLVELDKQPLLLFPEDSWFPAKVEVKSPDGDIYNFPVYRWISDSKVHRFREGTGPSNSPLKGFEDSHHLGRYSREQELKQRQKDYCWDVYVEGIPHCIKTDGPSSLPPEVASFTVSYPTSLGKLVLVELDKKPLFLFPEDSWFPAKVEVKSPDGEIYNFPVYRWISDSKVHRFREGTALKGFEDSHQLGRYSREQELKQRQKDYCWDVYVEGIPHCIKADGPLSLPAEVRFSFTKQTEFLFTKITGLAELKLKGLVDNKTNWTNIDDIDRVFCCKQTDISGTDNLHKVNPTKLCNIFLCDYKRMGGGKANTLNDEKQYLMAPLVLLHKTPDDKLMPIAIQLKQKPAEDNPIFLPSDSEHDWLMAKIFVRSADFSEHQLNVHLLRTHLLAEVFAVSLLRNVPMVHPLHKLLIPHTRYTLQINFLARNTLISEEGVFTKFSASGGEGMITILRRSLSSVTYSSLCVPEDIAERAVKDVPNFYYRDDALRLWDTINSNLPVTDKMVFPDGCCSLAEEIKKGNIFLCDYKQMDGVKTNTINDEKQYLMAPLVLLHKTPDDKLMPIAIQLKQKPAEDNPIFLPSDSEHDWLMAKIFVRSADFNEHQLNVHLLRTHLLAEVFAVSLLRNVPMVHPLHKLLIPHTRYTLQINFLARNRLISEEGVFTKFSASGGEGMITILRRSLSSVTYSSLCVPEDIAERGVKDVPNFYYRDDALRLWDTINRFVRGILTYYYKTDAEVQQDSELQKWILDIFEHGFLSQPRSGIPQKLTTVDELIKFVTMVIFTGSAQHAAVNSGQFDFGSWMPNTPISLQLPPPTKKGEATEETMLKTLPDVNTTVQGMATMWLLSQQSSDFAPLGQYSEDHFSEETPRQMIANFQKELAALSAAIKERNKTLEVPYTFLDPEEVENSVAI